LHDLWEEFKAWFGMGSKVEQNILYTIRINGTDYAIDTTKLIFVAQPDSFFSSLLEGTRKRHSAEPVVFGNINANDITDAMTVKIISVDGIDAERAVRDGYIRITTGAITPSEWEKVFKSLPF
jgi:hypothetical protein